MSNFGKEFLEFKISQMKKSSKLMKDAFRNIEKFDNGETTTDFNLEDTPNDNLSPPSDIHLSSDKGYDNTHEDTSYKNVAEKDTQNGNPNELVYLGDSDKQKRVA